MTYNRWMEKVAEEILGNETQMQDLILSIVDEAGQYFEDCPSDFCLQYCNGQSIVFGGSNRLIWTPKGGFRPDRELCSEAFLEHFDRLEER